MNDHDDRLSALDRRGRDAARALDDAVGHDVPEFSAASNRNRQPMLVAAAAVVIVLIGAAVWWSGDNGGDSTTIAGGGSVTHLVLEDPAPFGLELAGAFDAETAAEAGSDAFAEGRAQVARVHGPISDDPWASPVVEYSLPATDTTADGTPIEIGAPDAYYSQTGLAPMVRWREGDRVRFLTSAVSRDELVALAQATVDAGSVEGAPLPDHQILFSGAIGEILPAPASGLGSVPGAFGVGYQDVGSGSGRGLVISTVPGSDEAWRATTALTPDASELTVRGRPARAATYDIAGGLREISWLEDDGTLVRVNTFGNFTDDAVRAMLDDLVAIDEDEFQSLLEANHSDPTDRSDSDTVEGSVSGPADSIETGMTTTTDGRTVLHELISSNPEVTFRVRIFDNEEIELEHLRADGSAGVGFPLDGLDRSQRIELDLPDGGVAYGGLLGPLHDNPPTAAEVHLERADGAPLDLSDTEGWSIGTSGGPGTFQVFTVLLPASLADEDLVLVGDGPEGTVRLDL